MSEQLTFASSLSAISLPALAAGPARCASPVGQMTKEPGLDLAPASRSVAPAKEKVKPTKDTSGQCSESLSASQKLTTALGNRLRARLAVYGSPEYKLTWKEWVLPSGLRICAVRASGLRISDSGFTGWPTPNAMEGGQTSRGGDRKDEKLMGGLAKLCGWRTPTQGDAQRGVEQNPKERDSKAGTASLNNEAAMSGWPSPSHRENGGGEYSDPKKALARLSSGHQKNLQDVVQTVNPDGSLRGRGPFKRMAQGRQVSIQDQVRLVSGMTPNGTNASTESKGAFLLNAHFSRWLQGYPAEWLCSEVLETLSTRKLPRSLSAHLQK